MHFLLRPQRNAELLTLVAGVETPAEAVEKACAHAEANGACLTRAVAVIDSRDCFLRNYSFPIANGKQLDQAARFEFEDDLPVDASELIMDYFRGGTSEFGTHVCAAAVRRERVAEMLAVFREHGVSLTAMDMDAAAFGRACASRFAGYERLVGLEVGERRTLFCLVVRGRVRSIALFRLGAADLIEALAREGGLSCEEVDRRLVLGKGEDDGTESMRRGLEKFLQRLLREVYRQFGEKEWPSRFILSGDIMRIQGLKAAFEEASGGGLEVWEESCLELGGEMDEGQRVSGLAVGYGAAEESGGSFNFLREEFAVGGRSWSRDALFAAALLLAVLFSWGGYVYASLVSGERELQYLRDATGQVCRDALPGVGADMMPGQYRSILETRVSRLSDTPGGGDGETASVIETLRTVSSVINQKVDVEFLSLSLDSRRFDIQGETRSMNEVDAVRVSLEGTRLYKDVKIKNATSDKRSGRIRFEIEVMR
ncbi:MAG: hypothetical protein V3571_11360 [Pseudodesulfovibrio sp.]